MSIFPHQEIILAARGVNVICFPRASGKTYAVLNKAVNFAMEEGQRRQTVIISQNVRRGMGALDAVLFDLQIPNRKVGFAHASLLPNGSYIRIATPNEYLERKYPSQAAYIVFDTDTFPHPGIVEYAISVAPHVDIVAQDINYIPLWALMRDFKFIVPSEAEEKFEFLRQAIELAKPKGENDES